MFRDRGLGFLSSQSLSSGEKGVEVSGYIFSVPSQNPSNILQNPIKPLFKPQEMAFMLRSGNPKPQTL